MKQNVYKHDLHFILLIFANPIVNLLFIGQSVLDIHDTSDGISQSLQMNTSLFYSSLVALTWLLYRLFRLRLHSAKWISLHLLVMAIIFTVVPGIWSIWYTIPRRYFDYGTRDYLQSYFDTSGGFYFVLLLFAASQIFLLMNMLKQGK